MAIGLGTVLMILFGLVPLGAGVALVVLAFRALLKYIRCKDMDMRQKAAPEKRPPGRGAACAPHCLQHDAGICCRCAWRQPPGRVEVGAGQGRPQHGQLAGPCQAVRCLRRRTFAGSGISACRRAGARALPWARCEKSERPHGQPPGCP